MFIEEARKRLPEPFTQERVDKIVEQHENHKYDSVYQAFEDAFRGSREEIKTRVSTYIPLLNEHRVGSEQMPVLDVGCGRGEWLELLRENGLTASGVDRDSMMVEMCRSRNLNVTENEALAHLKSLPDGSLGAVTSFHMVEHLAFDETLAFIDEALRVLKPGGLIILETPNPRILSVGAHTFWLDPTHRKPLPSLMLRFFVEARGFCDANVQELHPYPPGALFPDDGKGVTNRLNDLLYGPQDYAVIARKARLG
jgi:O-antigen chain-terminating methyltransferase